MPALLFRFAAAAAGIALLMPAAMRSRRIVPALASVELAIAGRHRGTNADRTRSNTFPIANDEGNCEQCCDF